MKNCSMLYVIRDLRIKTTMTYHHTVIRIAKKLRTLAIPDAGEDAKEQELSLTAAENAKWDSHFGREIGSFLQN